MSPDKRGFGASRPNHFHQLKMSPNKLVSGLSGQIAFLGSKSHRIFVVLGWRVKKPRQCGNVTGYSGLRGFQRKPLELAGNVTGYSVLLLAYLLPIK